MLSDYYGDQVCYAPGERADNKVWDCIPTVAEALRQRNDGGIVVNATGVTVQVTKRQISPCIKGHPSVNKHTNHVCATDQRHLSYCRSTCCCQSR